VAQSSTSPKPPLRYKFVVYEAGAAYMQRNLGEYNKINHAIRALKTFMKQRIEAEVVVLDMYEGTWMCNKAPIATSYAVHRLTTCRHIGKYFLGDIWTNTLLSSREVTSAMKEKEKLLNSFVASTKDPLAHFASALEVEQTQAQPYGSPPRQN
jgi:hypothetical protein